MSSQQAALAYGPADKINRLVLDNHPIVVAHATCGMSPVAHARPVGQCMHCPKHRAACGAMRDMHACPDLSAHVPRRTAHRHTVSSSWLMQPQLATESPEHVDVLIVGAGLSGIGAACHLQSECPGKSYAILEARERIGGTWDLFRYPGIRSDSDMYTLGYAFKPWKGGEVDRRRRPRSWTTSARPPGRTASTGNIRFTPSRRAGRVVESAERAGRSRSQRRHRRAVRMTCDFLFLLQRLLPLRRGLHTGVRRPRDASPARSCIPSTGPRTSTTPASGSS